MIISIFDKPYSSQEAKVLSDYGVLDSDLLRLSFTFEEMQAYLTKQGYKLVLIKGKARVYDTQSEGVEVVKVGEPYKKEFAVFIVPDADFWEKKIGEQEIDLDDPYIKSLRIDQVFLRELKKQLLNPIPYWTK